MVLSRVGVNRHAHHVDDRSGELYMAASPEKPIDILKLSRRDRQRLLGEMDQQRRRHPRRTDRRQARVSYDVARVLIALAQPEGGSIRYSVVPRNLSSQGLAFIHGQFIYDDSRCEVVLPTLDQSWVRKMGTIAMCRHVKGLVHEASIVFDDLIHLDRFIARTPAAPAPLTSSAMGDWSISQPLVGRVLIIDAFDSDRHLLALWLERMGLQTSQSRDTAEALSMRPDRFDLIVMDPLRHTDGWEVVRRMRSAGMTVPIIGLCADDRDESRASAQAAGCNAFLGKPYKPHLLHMTIEQLLLAEEADAHPADGPLYSRFAGDAQMLPLIQAFAGDVQLIGDDLEDAMAQQDMTILRGLCQQLKGAGDGYGFASLTDQAKRVSQLFQVAQPNVDDLDQAVAELIEVIRRVRVK